MKRKSNKKILKGFSWLYIIAIVFLAVLAVVVLCVPEVTDAVKTGVPKGIDKKTFLLTTICISALIELWYFWLLRRYISGKSKGTLYMVLLILSVIGGVINIFTQPGASTFSLVINVVILYFLIKSKNEDKK